MKAGVLQFFSWPERRVPLETVYERALQRIDIMDQTGYDAVWLAEHHFNTYSVCPSVHLMGMHVAGRTRNLRIGTAVSLAAFYHPLRLAEEVALLDVLSGGRVNWGAGRGFDMTEFRAFNVPREESYPRFREAVDIVLESWRKDRITYHGDYFHFDDIEVLPKPMQKPHPPVWLASTSPEAIAWSGERGYTIMLDPHSAHRDIAAKRERYERRWRSMDTPSRDARFRMARLLAIGETAAEAEQIARSGAGWTVAAYANAAQRGGARGAFETDGDPVERYLNDVIIHGTPEAVGDKIEQLREEMFLDYLLCAPLSHGTFMLFTEKVLPRFL